LKPFDPSAPVVVDTPPAIIRNDTSRAEQVVEQVIQLSNRTVINQLDLVDLLAEFVDGDYYAADHCQSLSQFLKKRNLELSSKEIDKLVKISKVSASLGITREMLLKAKVNKTKVIFDLDPDLDYTDPNTEEVTSVADIMYKLVIDAGNGTSLRDIKKTVDLIKGKTEGEDSVIKFWKMPVFKSREEFLEETIEIAIQASGDTVGENGEAKDISRATAIERIFAEARSGFALEAPEEQQGGTFEDAHFVRDDEGRDYETGAE
jgi:hypothetical protein